MSIKEQIEKWQGESQPIEYPNGETIWTADLKALAASHDRLIRNLRVMASAAENRSELLPESFKIAWDTIEEAEKLSGHQAFEHVTNGDPCPCEPRIEKIEVEKL